MSVDLHDSKRKFCPNHISTTKYNVLSFLPVFLLAQFSLPSNLFFLFLSILQFIPGVSTVGKYTTPVPLSFILFVSAVREIVEDVGRYRADKVTNLSKVQVLRNGRLVWIDWQDIVVGDIVKVENGCPLPADMLLLCSSEANSMCYIQTANLDGETDLKVRQPVPSTAKLSIDDLVTKSGILSYDSPNKLLYEFRGTIRFSGQDPQAIGPNQLMQRGTRLANTKWAAGLVIYTGHQTKTFMNAATPPPPKRSSVDVLTNRMTIFMFFVLLTLALVSAGFKTGWEEKYGMGHWYLEIPVKTDNWWEYLKHFSFDAMTFFLTLNNLIPISLQVTCEMVRFVQAKFINNDIEMYHPETDTPALVRTSSLNEELGQVKYIFSDKTGTLTRNIMEYNRASIGGKVYMASDNTEILRDLEESDCIEEFLTLLAVCHTVVPERDERNLAQINYQANSPDEKALVEGAARIGFALTERSADSVTFFSRGEEHVYQVLHVIEFNSDRKRMSVVVRTPSGDIKLFCKGADTVIYQRLAPVHDPVRQVTNRHIESFSLIGLRTLCLAVRHIPDDEYEEWRLVFQQASTSSQNREEKICRAAELIEKDLTLLGATAIEDKLQEGVPDTIHALLEAGIRIWVLTGDKQQTAINIGHSCRLLDSSMDLIIMNDKATPAKSLNATIRQLNARSNLNNSAVIIDGQTLALTMADGLKNDFIDLCIKCKVVICCRVTPGQKADVVEAVTVKTGSVTLSIGDGANDVPMIQKAKVGVGIAGMEGMQAANVSDYSIGQFRFLRRLLFVHGATCYYRITRLILYSFSKNITMFVMQFWFSMTAAWSGRILFEPLAIMFYNVFFTALPPFAFGLFDRKHSAELAEANPKLYKSSQSSVYFNWKVFFKWIINALIASVVVFGLTVLLYGEGAIWSDGRGGDHLVLGDMTYTYVILTVCCKAALEVTTWTCMTVFTIFGSMFLWIVFLIVHPFLISWWSWIPGGDGLSHFLFEAPIFFFGAAVVPMAALLIDFTQKAFVKIHVKDYLLN